MVMPNTETDYGPGGHRYNDDLLLSKEARNRASEEFEAVYHLLDHERLRNEFAQSNQGANRAKRKSHVAGFWAVMAAVAALASAALEPVWGGLSSPWPHLIAIISAGLGLASFGTAAFILAHGKRKTTWLYMRLYAERLRQFHFQTFVWRLPEIAASLSCRDSADKYRRLRDDWFTHFQTEFQANADAQLSAILHPVGSSPIWLHNFGDMLDDPELPTGVDLTAVFSAYKALRFDEQLNYAEYMLRDFNRDEPQSRVGSNGSRWRWPWYPGVDFPLRTKTMVLHNLFILSCGTLVLLHTGILMSHFGGPQVVAGELADVMIVLVALIAIGIKTLADGFGFRRDIERYEEYRVVVGSLMHAFTHASSARRKVRVMMELERVAFEEMRIFLRSHYEATFLM